MIKHKIYEDFDGIKEEIIMREDTVNDFMNLPYTEQLRMYFQKGCKPMKNIVRYENSEKYLSLEKIQGSVEFTGTHFYVKHQIVDKFLYKKENKKTFSRYERRGLLDDLMLFPRFDWIKKEHDNGHVHFKVFSNSIVRDILAGKLTNVEEVVKKYLKSLHLKNIDWKIFVRYLVNDYTIPLNWLKVVTTDVNEAMTKLCEQPQGQFKDIIEQSLSLGRTVNPRWSKKRMEEEHLKMTRMLMKKEIDHKEQIPIYKECPVFDYPCHILNTEKEVFEEGLDMHHCIYTCYWKRINNKEYLGLSFYEPERFTLGLKRTNGKFEFDQAYLIYDKEIGQASIDMINKFLNDDVVVEQITKFGQDNPTLTSIVPKVEDVEDVDNDLPF